MGAKKEQARHAKNRDDIREQCQKLVLNLLTKANADLEKEGEPDYVRLMGILDKGTKFLAIDNKIDEGDYGDNLDDL
mgnify:CR=1 FL=1